MACCGAYVWEERDEFLVDEKNPLQSSDVRRVHPLASVSTDDVTGRYPDNHVSHAALRGNVRTRPPVRQRNNKTVRNKCKLIYWHFNQQKRLLVALALKHRQWSINSKQHTRLTDFIHVQPRSWPGGSWVPESEPPEVRRTTPVNIMQIRKENVAPHYNTTASEARSRHPVSL